MFLVENLCQTEVYKGLPFDVRKIGQHHAQLEFVTSFD